MLLKAHLEEHGLVPEVKRSKLQREPTVWRSWCPLASAAGKSALSLSHADLPADVSCVSSDKHGSSSQTYHFIFSSIRVPEDPNGPVELKLSISVERLVKKKNKQFKDKYKTP